jgi:pyruvate dehydrogenase E2 component (dihydrolipoamide acetyltransferase)
MATEIKLPALGENVEEGEVVAVLVEEGDAVEKDQPLIELETDKATVEVPADAAGTVQKIHVSSGDTIKVGQVIVTLEESEESEESDRSDR